MADGLAPLADDRGEVFSGSWGKVPVSGTEADDCAMVGYLTSAVGADDLDRAVGLDGDDVGGSEVLHAASRISRMGSLTNATRPPELITTTQ